MEFYSDRKSQLDDLLSSISDERLEHVKSAFIKEFNSNEVMERLYKSKDFDNPIVQGRWYEYLISRNLASNLHDFENYRNKRL